MAEPAEAFFARLRASLARSGDWRQPEDPDAARSPEPFVLPVDSEGAVENFVREFTAVSGEVHRVTAAGLTAKIVELAVARSAKSYASWATPLLSDPALHQALAGAGVTRLPLGTDAAREGLRNLEIGLSEPDCGVAETGSLVLIPGPGRSRLATAMARYHFAVLPVARVVTSLTEVPARLRAAKDGNGQMRSDAVLVTGPSRTGDIEGQIVLGAHGALELHLLLVG